MKKKLFLMVVMIFVFAVVFTLAVSAGAVHNENTVDYDATVTLNSGAVCNLFDSEKDALIWYLGANDELQSIKAQDSRVKYSFSGLNPDFLINVEIDCDNNGTFEISNNKIVVLNLMDDDIVFGTYEKNGETIVRTGVKTNEIFNGNDGKGANVEYVYLRLDTTNISGRSFANCKKLKYINLEDLTALRQIGAHAEIGYNYGACFEGCTSLFDGQLVDLSKTQLYVLAYGAQAGGGNFQGVPLAGIKLPVTLCGINQLDFKNCTKLTTVYLGYNANFYRIADSVFEGCTSLEKIFFVGTEEQFSALLSSKVSQTGNSAFFDVVGENKANIISYVKYEALADKSGKYAVYDYSPCEYYGGIHGEIIIADNPCVGICQVCEMPVVNHSEGAVLNTSIEYTSFDSLGTKKVVCTSEGCTYSVVSEAPALFVCLGYSAPENGDDGISIKYTVNGTAIAEYERVTGATLSYGMFATTKQAVGNGDIFDADGNTINGAIALDVTKSGFAFIALKMVGFDKEDSKEAFFAIGAYAITTLEGEKSYSYLQEGTPLEGEKYAFIKYNDFVK